MQNASCQRGGCIVTGWRRCSLLQEMIGRKVREINQHPRLLEKLVTHGFLHPSGLPWLTMVSVRWLLPTWWPQATPIAERQQEQARKEFVTHYLLPPKLQPYLQIWSHKSIWEQTCHRDYGGCRSPICKLRGGEPWTRWYRFDWSGSVSISSEVWWFWYCASCEVGPKLCKIKSEWYEDEP